MELTEFVRINKKKEILFLWDFVGIIALYHLKVDGLSKEKKNFRQEFKEKDSNLQEKRN